MFRWTIELWKTLLKVDHAYKAERINAWSTIVRVNIFTSLTHQGYRVNNVLPTSRYRQGIWALVKMPRYPEDSLTIETPLELPMKARRFLFAVGEALYKAGHRCDFQLAEEVVMSTVPDSPAIRLACVAAREKLIPSKSLDSILMREKYTDDELSRIFDVPLSQMLLRLREYQSPSITLNSSPYEPSSSPYETVSSPH